MNLTSYLRTFQEADHTPSEAIIPALTELADYLVSILSEYSVERNQNNQVTAMKLFDHIRISKTDDPYHLHFEYCGHHPILADYFKDLDNNLSISPLSSLWHSFPLSDEDYRLISNDMVNSGLIAILSAQLEIINLTHRKAFKNSAFDFNTHAILDPQCFESQFLSPIRDFLNILFANRLCSYDNCDPALANLVNRRKELVDLYMILVGEVRKHLFNNDILKLLGNNFNLQSVWAYGQYLKINDFDTINKLREWGNEHPYKPLLIFSGRFFNRLNIDDRETFSTTNLILSADDKQNIQINSDSPIFYDRVSYKYLWKMNEQLLLTLLHAVALNHRNGLKVVESQPSVVIFMNFMYWLAHTKKQNIQPRVLAIILMGRFVQRYTRKENTAQNIQKFFYAMEALYEYSVIQEFQHKIDLKVHIDHIQDYMVADLDGTIAYLTFTKKLTGKALKRKSDDWHTVVDAERYRHIKFDLEPEKYEFDGVVFTLITNIDDLINEGIEMNHCAPSYASDIYNMDYVIFSVRSSFSGERATLGFKIDNGQYYFDQLMGFKNQQPCDELIEATEDFRQLYTNKMGVQYQ